MNSQQTEPHIFIIGHIFLVDSGTLYIAKHKYDTSYCTMCQCFRNFVSIIPLIQALFYQTLALDILRQSTRDLVNK